MKNTPSIGRHRLIVACKKLAKQLQKQNQLTFMQCLTLAAQAQGFKDWFSLQHHVKILLNQNVCSLFEKMLHEAIEKEVSDIHISIQEHNNTLYFREHGSLYLQDINQYFSSTEDIFNESEKFFHSSIQKQYVNLYQEFDYLNRRFSLRGVNIPVHSSPNFKGMNIVFHLSAQDSVISLYDLGFPQDYVDNLYRMGSKKTGFIIFSGRAGCGKTTSTNALLKMFGHKKIVNFDSCEEISFGTNIKISSDENLIESFKQVQRMDFDIATMEIRNFSNPELLHSFLEMTHQKMFIGSTHSGSNINTLRRLMDLGLSAQFFIEKENVALVHQEMVSILCPHCQVPLEQHEKQTLAQDIEKGEYHRLKVDNFSHLFKQGAGCEHCHHGYRGKLAIPDIFILDPAMAQCLYEKNWHALERLNEQNIGMNKVDLIKKLFEKGLLSLEMLNYIKPSLA